MRFTARWMMASLAVAAVAGCGGHKSLRGRPPEQSPESPRIAALVEQLRSGKTDALEGFLNEIKGKAPLVEPVAGDDAHRLVSFVWRGNASTRSVSLLGGPPSAEWASPLARLADSDLWYRTDRLPKGARFTYVFDIDRPTAPPRDLDEVESWARQFPPSPDPLNPHTLLGRSVAELPGAPPQSRLERRPGVPTGSLDRLEVVSQILGERRPVSVYTPPGYARSGGPYGLIVVLDGQAYGSARDSPIPLPTILDNLIAEKAVAPVVAVLVDNLSRQTRDRDLPCSAPFADFLAKELVPWARDRYGLVNDPSRLIVCGSSAGGLCAAYCGLRHPEVFGGILSQSGWFAYHPEHPRVVVPDYAMETGWLARQFATGPKGRLRFYLEVGRFERSFLRDAVAENRRMRDVLMAKGYPVTYSEYDGDHSYLCWRGTVADGLIALAGDLGRK